VKATSTSLGVAALGALGGAVTNQVLKRSPAPVPLSATFLVTAALAYPLADLGAARGPERNRERAAVAVTIAIGLAGTLMPPRLRRNVLAAGWLSHAAFDVVHHRTSSSRLPEWYPAFCAGFDAVVAGRLARGSTR
jgi:hypothetical protein